MSEPQEGTRRRRLDIYTADPSDNWALFSSVSGERHKRSAGHKEETGHREKNETLEIIASGLTSGVKLGRIPYHNTSMEEGMVLSPPS